MIRPRTSPLQAIPTRPARAKHSLKSKLSEYSYNQSPVSIPRYVTRMHPDASLQTRKAMVNAIERYLATDTGKRYGMPTPTQCNILFEGLID